MSEQKLPPPARSPGPAYRIPLEAVNAAKDGRVIEAIKIVRESGNFGLGEAKSIIDQLLRSVPEKTTVAHQARRARGLSPGELPRGDGGGGKWLVLFAIVAIAAFSTLYWR
jgi:hypothetical protein